jgi:hypothetical protein
MPIMIWRPHEVAVNDFLKVCVCVLCITWLLSWTVSIVMGIFYIQSVLGVGCTVFKGLVIVVTDTS